LIQLYPVIDLFRPAYTIIRIFNIETITKTWVLLIDTHR